MIAASDVASVFTGPNGLTTPRASETATPAAPADVSPAGVVSGAAGWLVGRALKPLTVWIAAMIIGLVLVMLGLWLLVRDLLPSPAAIVAAA